MSTDNLKDALDLAQKLRHLFVATSGKEGLPHIAAAARIEIAPSGLLAVTSWFCPQTVANLEDNKRVSLVVWDQNRDIGFQLLGEAENILEVGYLDEFVPELEFEKKISHVQRQLLVRVDKIIEFRHAPHSDL